MNLRSVELLFAKAAAAIRWNVVKKPIDIFPLLKYFVRSRI